MSTTKTTDTNELLFRVIGCSSGLPHPRLACSSYLVKQGNRLLLFDTGEGLSSALRRLQVDPTEIGTVFISHLHSDHFAGLPLFIQFNYLADRSERLDIFLPGEAVSFVRRLLAQVYMFPAKLPFELELHGISKSLVFEMTDLEVKPWPNTHLEAQAAVVSKLGAPNKLESYSFLIQSPDRKIVYSSDIGSLDDLLPALPGTNLLALDGNHIDLTELPTLAAGEQIEKVLLTHLPENFDTRPFRSEFAAVKGSRIIAAKEGLTIRV